MGTKGTQAIRSARPALPPKPQIPPVPRPRTKKWRRVTDVILRPIPPEIRDVDRVKHRSFPMVRPSTQGITYNSIVPLELDSSLELRPIPKPRLRWSPSCQDNQSQPADGKETDTSSQSSITANENTFSGEPGERFDNSEKAYMEVNKSAYNEVECFTTVVLVHGLQTDSKMSPVSGAGRNHSLTKHLPSSRIHSSDKVSQAHSQHLATMPVSNAPLQSLVAELQKKIHSDNQEKEDSDVKKPKVKRSTSKNILRKLSPTMSSPQKKSPSLAELILSPFQSKPQTRTEKAQHTPGVSNQESPRQDDLEAESLAKEPEDFTEDIPEHLSHASSTQSTQESEYEQDSILPPSGPKDNTQRNSEFSRTQRQPLEGLWQERSIVQESGILDQLSKEQLLLQESMYEVVTSEETYLLGLGVAVDHFLESPELKQALAPRDRKSLFSGITKIRELSQNGPFSAYVDYIRNMPYQEQTLHNLGKESPQIVEILNKLQEDPRCNRLSLKSFLVLPFQRITRLKILVEAILKRTEDGSESRASAARALKEISKVVEACNREVDRMKKMEEMVIIANKTEFECKALPLVSSSRWLVRQGEMVQLSVKEKNFGQRKLCTVHLLLFNDLLLVTTKKGSDRFVVHDHVHRSLVVVSKGNDIEEDLEGFEVNKIIQLALLKNHRGSTSQYLLQVPSQAERDSWMELLSQHNGGDESIYEEWGFLEGRRLSDGERGWFPTSCVKELTNEHVQRRHLRQRYHVMQAATRMMNRRYPTTAHHSTSCFK
ncbi:ephexin-1 [Chanos chanos]|uniref:Ephexin-1 n=1 Tax=Chanos chanos TaxID=29144 RepID=A0A6J2WN00_CHACN|nr:ephexin-1-like [Chanos chanos]